MLNDRTKMVITFIKEPDVYNIGVIKGYYNLCDCADVFPGYLWNKYHVNVHSQCSLVFSLICRAVHENISRP